MKDKSRHRLSQFLICSQGILVIVLAYIFTCNQKTSDFNDLILADSFQCQIGLLFAVAFIFNIAYQHKLFMKLGTV